MSNDGTNWHSDDELASALERALEIPADSAGAATLAYAQQDAPTATASNDFSDLFAALVEPDSQGAVESADQGEAWVDETDVAETEVAQTEVVDAEVAEPAVDQGHEHAGELVFESLDDFKPRTNFIPVVGSDAIEQPAVMVEPQTSTYASQDVPTHAVTLSSAQVTQPVRYDRQRPTFDEIVFGVTSAPETN